MQRMGPTRCQRIKPRMKNILYLLLLTSLLSCKKDETDHQGGIAPGEQLISISTAIGLYQSFEYSGGRLVKENWHSSFCTTPVDEHVYSYANGELKKTESVLRSMLSSTVTMCDPSSGEQLAESYEYDTQGRLRKAIRANSYTEYEYTGAGLVSKQTVFDQNGSATWWTTFEHDARGNITKVVDMNGATVNYEYDDKINPLYIIHSRPGIITPFNSSPNNVIRASGAVPNFQRFITEYRNDLPVTIEENGITYTYSYR